MTTNIQPRTLEERTDETELTEFDGEVAFARYKYDLSHPQTHDPEQGDRESWLWAHKTGYGHIMRLVDQQAAERRKNEQKEREFQQRALWTLYNSLVKNYKNSSLITVIGTVAMAAPGFISAREAGMYIAATALAGGATYLWSYTCETRAKIKEVYQAYQHYGGEERPLISRIVKV